MTGTDAIQMKFENKSKKILDLINYYDDAILNLEPAFQRESVWKPADREKFIDSIIRGYPTPAIVLYKNYGDSKLVYDVIDGKQRLESILKFTGHLRGPLRGKFSVKTQLGTSLDSERTEVVNWTTLEKGKRSHRINHYEVAVIEVEGPWEEIFNLFLRINSTGMPLTRQEKLQAKYFKSDFLKQVYKLAQRYRDYLVASRILSVAQVARMKHVELISEIALSVHSGDVLNKKTALDRVMKDSPLTPGQLHKATKKTITVLNRLGRMFPNLRQTRFRHLTDFYTLAVLVGKYESEGLVLTDSRKNELAADLLAAFSTGVDLVRQSGKNIEGTTDDQKLYREYALTVGQATDSSSQRRKRQSILDGVLRTLFETKDPKRTFSLEQRRIMWNTSETIGCAIPGCKTALTWDNFTMDHIKPFTKGGATELKNAALMCHYHNSSKGNRTTGRMRLR